MAKTKNTNDLQKMLMASAHGTRSYAESVSKKDPLPDLNGLMGSDEHYRLLSIYDLEDAPEDWNKYPRTKDVNADTYLETKLSIAENGVLDALRVWERDNGKYMVISGHNRKDISLELIEEYPESREKWEKVMCYVVGAHEKTEEQIRAEIYDANLHRNFNDMDKRTQMLILDDRIGLMMGNRTPKGEDVIRLAEKMGLKKSNIYNLLAIRNDLYPGLKEIYFDGKLNIKAAIRLASLNVSVQEYLCDNYGDRLTTKTVNAMPGEIFNKGLAETLKKGEIDDFFAQEVKPPAKVKKMSVSVPEGHEEEFKKMFEEWLKTIQG